jgi:hypothetical protein
VKLAKIIFQKQALICKESELQFSTSFKTTSDKNNTWDLIMVIAAIMQDFILHTHLRKPFLPLQYVIGLELEYNGTVHQLFIH